MFRGLWRLTWIEIKVFMREPLGAIGSIVMPVLIFVLMGRLGSAMGGPSRAATNNFFRVNVPVFVAVLIAINTVLSLCCCSPGNATTPWVWTCRGGRSLSPF